MSLRDLRPQAAAQGARLALLAGAGWLVLGVESITRPHQENYRNAVFLVPWLLTLAAFAQLHRVQKARGGRLEQWGYWAVVVTMVGVGTGHVTLALTGSGLGVAAVPAWILAMIAFGIGTGRAGVMPYRVGVAIAGSQLLVVAIAVALSPIVPLHSDGSFSGAVGHGAVLLTLAAGLRAAVPAPHPVEHNQEVAP